MRLWIGLAVLSFSTLASLANPMPASAGTKAKRYIVGIKTGTSKAKRDAALATLGGKTVLSIKSNGTTSDEFEALVVESHNAAPAVTAAPRAAFRNDIFSLGAAGAAADEDILIEEDYTTKWIEAMPATFQSVPLPNFKAVMGGMNFNLRAAIYNEIPWGIKRVKALAAWDTTKGKGVKVAVIDTGIRSDHTDLNGQVVGGYNAVDDSERDGAAEDDNGHGTHVAGTIAAKQDNKGVVGVAPEVKLYAVKVLDKDGSGSLSDVIRGMIWCANNNIQVANMSLGSSMPSEMLHRALRYAKARGVVVVAAAGNSGEAVSYPGAYPESIAVSASDSEDKLADFSSRGPEVDFVAPGVDIVSTWHNGNTVSLSGTSMAAPHVTGLAALATAQGARGLNGPNGVMAALQKATKTIGLKAEEEGKGMIDAGRLVE